MKVVILAGGLGTRLQEETVLRPKPMVEIGGYPMLWHIMNIYAAYGHREFVVALGYKAEVVKDYFIHFSQNRNDLTVELKTGNIRVYEGDCEDWTVHLVNTGLHTQTGGRIRRLRQWVGEEPFLLTYGDGVSNVDINGLVDFHRQHGKLATVTAVRPPARFGGLTIQGQEVAKFVEKPQIGEGWINGGFYVLEPEVLSYIEGDQTQWERQPMERLAEENQLMAYLHTGFWHSMDTLRDVQQLEKYWSENSAPWRIW